MQQITVEQDRQQIRQLHFAAVLVLFLCAPVFVALVTVHHIVSMKTLIAIAFDVWKNIASWIDDSPSGQQ